MKILILTQKIDENDDVLGFMHNWIKEFAKHCEQVTAIGLSVGEHHLPQNVKVLSLGKNFPTYYLLPTTYFFLRLRYIFRFYRYIITERHNYDTVFVHMNPEYVVLGGILWKFMGKKIGLWYAHGHVPFMLRIAHHGTDIVFTSTASGFRLPSKKLHIVGQGIDTKRFAFLERTYDKKDSFRVAVVGRISPVKDYETLLRAVKRLRDGQKNIALDIVGVAALPEQKEYEEKLRAMADALSITEVVRFHGSLSNKLVGGVLGEAHCFVNTSRTGSFDKAVGEAMATGLPILTSNEAFKEVLGSLAAQLMFPSGDDRALAGKLEELIATPQVERNKLGKELRELIGRNHSLSGFVQKILSYY